MYHLLLPDFILSHVMYWGKGMYHPAINYILQLLVAEVKPVMIFTTLPIRLKRILSLPSCAMLMKEWQHPEGKNFQMLLFIKTGEKCSIKRTNILTQLP